MVRLIGTTNAFLPQKHPAGLSLQSCKRNSTWYYEELCLDQIQHLPCVFKNILTDLFHLSLNVFSKFPLQIPLISQGPIQVLNLFLKTFANNPSPKYFSSKLSAVSVDKYVLSSRKEQNTWINKATSHKSIPPDDFESLLGFCILTSCVSGSEYLLSAARPQMFSSSLNFWLELSPFRCLHMFITDNANSEYPKLNFCFLLDLLFHWFLYYTTWKPCKDPQFLPLLAPYL